MSPNPSSHRRPQRQSRRRTSSNPPSFSGTSHGLSLIRNAKAPPAVLGLPYEILSYIFELGTFPLKSGEYYYVPPFLRFAVSCSHVCSYFRQVALSSPQLWTYIDFREGFPYERAQIFLQRSEDALLMLNVDLRTGDSTTQDDRRHIIDETVDQSSQIYAMIAPHIHRWKSFKLKADYYEIIWYWLQELSNKDLKAPLYLESFGMFCTGDWESAEEFRPSKFRNAISIFSGGTPRIRVVELWGVHCDWDTVPFLHGLKGLRLAFHPRDVAMTTNQFIRTLEKCPKLWGLCLHHSGPLKGSWPHSSLSLECLGFLELAFLDMDIAINIITRLQFPVLTDLAIDLEQESVEPFIDAFCLYRKFNTIDTIQLRLFRCSIPKARAFLQAIPNVKFMYLNFNYLTNSFLSVLMDRSPPACIKLETLKLSGLEFTRLRKLLRSRPTNTIKTLQLDTKDGWEKSQIRWLKKTAPSVKFFT